MSTDDPLLLLAALPWFDDELLAALGLTEPVELVEPTEGLPGARRLRAEPRESRLLQLRELPVEAASVHARVLEALLPRAASGEPAAGAACLQTLDTLAALLMQRGDWPALAGHVAQVRAAALPDPHARRQLDLYEGLALIRSAEVARGEALLAALVDLPDLVPAAAIRALNGLAQAAWFATRYDRALELYRRLHDLAADAGDPTYQGVALINMGMIYNDLDACDRALELSVASLAIFRSVGDHVRAAYALYEIGNNAMRLGRWELAQQHFDEAVRAYEQLGIDAGLPNLYWSQGLMHLQLGDHPTAERLLRHADALGQLHGADLGVTLDVCFDLGLIAQVEGRYDEALEHYARSAEIARTLGRHHWLSMIGHRRGQVLQRQGRHEAALDAYCGAIEGVESLRGATEGEEIKLGLLGTTQQIYESTVLLLLELDRPADAFDYVERARSRAFLDLLARKDPGLSAALDRPVATLAEVQASLPADALLVEYYTVGVVPRGEHLLNRLPPASAALREHLTAPPQTWVFAVTRDGLRVLRAELDPNTLRPQPGDPGPGRRLLRDRLLIHLHERLVAPIADLLDGRRLLYLVPHGPLHYVPFMALRSAGGAHLLAADGPAIAQAPSATVLLRNCLARPPRAATQALAIGYNDVGENHLRYAEAEARHVARLTGGVAWDGAEPKARRLASAGPQLRALHIAGHARYNPHDPLGSHLVLGESDSLSARAIIGEVELAADLVTLSACTSGLSHVVPGDELLGLQRAFLYAGAPTVVCTLWEAADFVALLVMERFYRSLAGGAAPALALRDAQVAVRQMTGRELAATLARWHAEAPELIDVLGELPPIAADQLDEPLYADPFYWAPFMLIGRAA